MSKESALEIINDAEKINSNELYLSFEQLSSEDFVELLPKIHKLKSLQRLYLNNNQLTNIESLRELTNLQVLSLDGNQLTDIESLRELTNLQALHLNVNELANIESLRELTNLRRLYLNNNQLTDIEPLKQLTNLQWLFLRGNPLPIPDEILADYTNLQKIINYYLQSLEGRPLNEAKIVVIGEARKGKTCLIKRLLYNTFDKDEDSTHGIAIYKWDNVPVNNQNVRLNVWDFADKRLCTPHINSFSPKELFMYWFLVPVMTWIKTKWMNGSNGLKLSAAIRQY